MGDLVLKGATSGQITVTPTAIAGTNTLTLPAATGNIITSADSGTVTQAMLAGNVAGNGPAFSAYQSSAQTPSASTWTKVQLQTEEFDTNNNFDSTTNYRFTPTVSGYYFVSGTVYPSGTTANALAAIYKNGSSAKIGTSSAFVTGIGTISTVNALIYFNGSTDYVELYINITSSVALNALANSTYFQAALVRAA